MSITFNDYSRLISDESIILLQTLMKLHNEKQYDTILYIINRLKLLPKPPILPDDIDEEDDDSNNINSINSIEYHDDIDDIINTRIKLDSNFFLVFNTLLLTTEKIMTESDLTNQIIEEFILRNTPKIISSNIFDTDNNDNSYPSISVDRSIWKKFVKVCKTNKIKVSNAFRAAIIDFLDDKYNKA